MGDSDADLADPMDELERKFKQERKELQAKIQALKKTATKGDKKKKKEVQEEIANLEADLDRQQKEEQENLQQKMLKLEQNVEDGLEKSDNNGSDEQQDIGTTNPRVTKAEKRRQKKVAASKERDARIQEQDDINLQGPRHKEMVAIVDKLRERSLSIYGIPADGNCLYSAVEHQLKETDCGQLNVDCKSLRKLAADYLRQNKYEFLPFMTNQDSGDLMSEGDFEAYCNKVEKNTIWGGQIELRALSDALKFPIEVIQAEGPPMIIGEQHLSSRKPIILTFHRYLYRLGEHYNSVAPYVEEEPEN